MRTGRSFHRRFPQSRGPRDAEVGPRDKIGFNAHNARIGLNEKRTVVVRPLFAGRYCCV